MKNTMIDIVAHMKQSRPHIHEESLSVAEVLELPAFQGYKLIAGAGGLQNRCRHMTILETPEGVSWLNGQEILLTAGYAFMNREEDKRNMMIEAHRQGVSAIAIKEGRYFGEIWPEFIEQADEYNIPLIVIPYELVYTRTISDFYDRLFFRKHEYILNLNNIYEKLLNLSLENKYIPEIIQTLSDLTSSQVWLLNSSFSIISSSEVEKTDEKQIEEYIKLIQATDGYANKAGAYLSNYASGEHFLNVYTIESDNQIKAHLLIVSDQPLNRLNRSSFEYGLPIIAMKLELLKGQETSRNKMNRSLVEIMLHKKDLPDSFYQNIERDLGWSSGGKIACVCITFQDSKESKQEALIDQTVDYLNELFQDQTPLCFEGSNGIYHFYKYQSDVELEDFVAALYRYLKQYREKFNASLGVSNLYSSLREIETIRNEAFLASLFTKQGVIYYHSLDTIRLLYPLKNDIEIQEYYGNTIKKLEDYDEENESALVKTLETFFRYNLKRNIVAEKLYIHVETLRYRINKIEELTGYSLNDAEGLFALQMGVKLRSLMKID